MKTFKILLALCLGLALASPALAASPVDVGGVPICIVFSGTSAGTAADATVTTRPGFIPDFIYLIEDGTDLTSTDIYTWFYGMGNGAIKDDDGAENLYVSSAGSGCWFDISTAGQVIIDAACQQNSGKYGGIMCRYSQ